MTQRRLSTDGWSPAAVSGAPICRRNWRGGWTGRHSSDLARAGRRADTFRRIRGVQWRGGVPHRPAGAGPGRDLETAGDTGRPDPSQPTSGPRQQRSRPAAHCGRLGAHGPSDSCPASLQRLCESCSIGHGMCTNSCAVGMPAHSRLPHDILVQLQLGWHGPCCANRKCAFCDERDTGDR